MFVVEVSSELSIADDMSKHRHERRINKQTTLKKLYFFSYLLSRAATTHVFNNSTPKSSPVRLREFVHKYGKGLTSDREFIKYPKREKIRRHIQHVEEMDKANEEIVSTSSFAFRV